MERTDGLGAHQAGTGTQYRENGSFRQLKKEEILYIMKQ